MFYGPFLSKISAILFFSVGNAYRSFCHIMQSDKLIEFAKSSKTEQRLIQQYEHATNKFVDVKACQKGFLDYCRDLEFYGYV